MIPYFVFDQIKIGPITIYTWGLMVGLGFLLVSWLFLWQIKKRRVDEKKILGLIFFVFLGAIFGARFFNIQAEMSFYGGFLFALVIGWLYIKKTNLHFWQMADLVAWLVPLGMFLGRIGCFLIKDHQGTLTNLPWGIVWPDGTIRHPIALYLALVGLLIFFILWGLRSRIKKQGQLFLIFLFLQAASRLGLDFLRADDLRYLSLTPSQWIAILIILVAVFTLLKRPQYPNTSE